MTNLRKLYKNNSVKLTECELKKDNELITYLQDILIHLDYLPSSTGADGVLGPNTKGSILKYAEAKNIELDNYILNTELVKSLYESQPGYINTDNLKLSSDFASRIVKYMLAHDYELHGGTQIYNIVYVEDISADGSKALGNQPNWFNDRRLLIQILNNKPTIIGNWTCTTEPGRYYTKRRMNPLGAARVKFGCYKSWKSGYHGYRKPYKSLVQRFSVPVYRDNNENFIRDKNDKISYGVIGLNQHHGFNARLVGKHSAGCLTARNIKGHFKFMDIVENDLRYLKNNNYVYVTSILPGDKV